MKPTVGSLFSGIGGLDLAAHWAGFETAWFVEKESFCQKVLAKHWPHVPIHDDIFTCNNLPHVDVVVGGFPCQPFSVAGARKGADDERYLLPEMLRIIREVKPYVVLFENVPGFPSLNDGTEFKYLLRTLAEMGFDAEWGHLSAADFGFPHIRERWFLVAYAVRGGCIRGGQWQSSNQSSQKREAPQRTQHWPKAAGFRQGQLGRQFGTFAGHIESRLGRIAHGLSYRLDKPQIPAFRGQTQFTFEPPRLAASTDETLSRIKALGNAVVPQVAYPIFVALMEWLQENNA